MLGSFLVIILLVFLVSAFILMFAARTPGEESVASADRGESAENTERRGGFDDLEELVEAISHDKELLAPAPSPEIPHVSLPNARLGGGAKDEMSSKVSGVIALPLDENPDEKRKYNRRLGDRRRAEAAVDEDRRIVQRCVWLRRKEDRRDKTLLTVSDAAETLGVPVEQIYRWLDETDIPFYQVTEGKRKAIRFEVNELLQWFSVLSSASSPDTDLYRRGKKGD